MKASGEDDLIEIISKNLKDNEATALICQQEVAVNTETGKDQFCIPAAMPKLPKLQLHKCM